MPDYLVFYVLELALPPRKKNPTEEPDYSRLGFCLFPSASSTTDGTYCLTCHRPLCGREEGGGEENRLVSLDFSWLHTCMNYRQCVSPLGRQAGVDLFLLQTELPSFQAMVWVRDLPSCLPTTFSSFFLPPTDHCRHIAPTNSSFPAAVLGVQGQASLGGLLYAANSC